MTKDAIISLLVGISLIGHIFGYFFWQYVKVINLYYVSVYFMMMNLGLVLMLSLNGRFMKYVSVAMFSFGGGFLYMEFAGDPQNWTYTNLATFIFIGVNSLLISRWIEKYKEKYHG